MTKRPVIFASNNEWNKERLFMKLNRVKYTALAFVSNVQSVYSFTIRWNIKFPFSKTLNRTWFRGLTWFFLARLETFI